MQRSESKRWTRVRRGQFVRAMAALALSSVMLTGCAAKRITADPVYFPSAPARSHVVHLKSFNALDELIPLKSSWVDALRGGVVSPFVDSPSGIDFHEGHLYICDQGSGVVHDWDLNTGRARQLGTSESLSFGTPVDVAAADDGTVYVTDAGRGVVFAIGFDGSVRKLKADRISYRPVAVTTVGGQAIVADIASHKIDTYTGGDSPEHSFGDVGSDEGNLYYPMGVAADASGRLFVSDTFNSRVQGFDANGEALVSMGQPGDRYGDMGKPRQLDVAPDGVIFVADPEFRRVHLFDDQGQLLMLLGTDAGLGEMPLPAGVAVADQLPESITSLVPGDFDAHYYVFVTNRIGAERISLYAVGLGRSLEPDTAIARTSIGASRR